jgi:acetyl-CoA carboxylase biotin carboxyl carrier protein
VPFFVVFWPKCAKNWVKTRFSVNLSLTLVAHSGVEKLKFFKLKNMDFKQIQELIKIVNKSNIGEVSIEQKDFRVTIKQKEDKITQVVSAAPVQMAAPAMAPQVAAAPASAPAPVAEKPKAAAPQADNLITVKSPMIGTFYRKSSPDKPNFVEVGADIAPGSVLCIIEAMKLFNEIESEVKGKIVKILVEDASPVEFDQPLFLVEPA